MSYEHITPTESELAALADGSLTPAQRERVLAQVQDSPELQAILAEQQRAVQLLGAIDVKAPEALRARVEAMVPANHGRRVRVIRLRRLAMAAVGVAVLVVALAIGLSNGGGQRSSPSGVTQTAALTLSSATLPAPSESSTHGAELTASVEGIAFPYWRERFGWRSSGARSDRVNGRTVTTVFYSDNKGRRVGYAIVAGPAWMTHGGSVIWRGKVAYRVLDQGGATVVLWERNGRLCVVAGKGVSTPTLLRLAGWSGGQPNEAQTVSS